MYYYYYYLLFFFFLLLLILLFIYIYIDHIILALTVTRDYQDSLHSVTPLVETFPGRSSWLQICWEIQRKIHRIQVPFKQVPVGLASQGLYCGGASFHLARCQSCGGISLEWLAIRWSFAGQIGCIKCQFYLPQPTLPRKQVCPKIGYLQKSYCIFSSFSLFLNGPFGDVHPFWDIPKPKDIYQRIIPMRSIVASRKISWGIWGFVPW